MRSMYSNKPNFLFNIREDQKVTKEYHALYNKIDKILDTNNEILSLVHNELKKLSSLNGRDSSHSTEVIFRMLLVKCIEQLSFRDLIIRVDDSNFLRNFSRIGFGKLMNFSLLDTAWKYLEHTTWDKINQLLLTYAVSEKKITTDSLRIDSTVCETNIHYPTDSSLLWDCYRTIFRAMQTIEKADNRYSMGYRSHAKKIKRLHTFISTQSSRKQKSTQRKVKQAMKVVVTRVEDLVNKGFLFVENAKAISSIENNKMFNTLQMLLVNADQVTSQARRSSIEGEVVPAKERVFSIFEDHTELLKRGKAQRPIEFGHLVTIAQSKEKFITYYAVNEDSKHDIEYKELALENHKKLFGKYPDKFAADKNYHVSAEDTKEWSSKINVYAVGKKGKRTEEEILHEHSNEFREMQKFRAGCEGSISVLKRVFGLKRCLYRGFKSFAASICQLVFCHNLVLLGKN